MMGYQITYFREDKKQSRSRSISFAVLFLTMFLGWTVRNWEEGTAFILEALFPVTATEAQVAAGEMARQIEEGAGVVQAFTDFCNTVFPGEMEGPY